MNWQNLTENLARAEIATFGEDAMYTPKAGSAFAVKVIFNNHSVDIDQDSGLAVLSDQPSVGVKNSDFLQEPKNGDKVVIRGENFVVRNIDRDGESMTHLMLHKE